MKIHLPYFSYQTQRKLHEKSIPSFHLPIADFQPSHFSRLNLILKNNTDNRIKKFIDIMKNSGKKNSLNLTDCSQGIHPKTRHLANSTTYKNYIIARRRFNFIEMAESCKQLS